MSSAIRLSPFSYVVLSLIGRGGATSGELSGMRERAPMLLSAPRSQWFAEPKRLAAAGLLTPEEEPGVTGPRVRYRLTGAALDALAAWQAQPLELPKLQPDALIRVLAADLAQADGDLRIALAGLRAKLAAERERARANMEVAERLGDRRERLLAQHRLIGRIVDALDDWAEEVSP